MTIEDYLRRVEFALRDLPWNMRRELAAEIRAHLDEPPEGTNLGARLGTPEEYVKQMRAAAGLERRRGPLAYLRARRPRNLILTVLVLTLIGLVIGSVVWIDGYQPLATGNTGYDPGAHASPAGDGEYVVFRQGKSFHYGMTVWNSGRFTVRVLGVPIQFGLPIKYRVLMSAPTRYAYGGIPRPYTPFRPFDLKPGEERGIVLSGVYTEPCSHMTGGGQIFLYAIPVRFSFLWRTRTAWISLPEQLAFDFRKGSGCSAAKP